MKRPDTITCRKELVLIAKSVCCCIGLLAPLLLIGQADSVSHARVHLVGSHVDISIVDDGPTYGAPRLTGGISYLNLDQDQRRGFYLKAQWGRTAGIQSLQSASIDFVDSTGTFIFMDSITSVDADYRQVQLQYGLIRPLKTWGDRHRLSWTRSIAYRYKANTTKYIEEVGDASDSRDQGHHLIGSIGLQYRWMITDKIVLGLDGQVLNVGQSITRSTPLSRVDDSSQTILSFDMSFVQGAGIWVGYRLGS